MKKILMFAVAILSISMSVCAQSVQEPDFEFEPFVANLQDSTLGDPLPCENAYIKAKAGASMYLVGIGKVKSYYYVDGVSSSLVLDKKSCLVINLGGQSPLQTISINKFEILKKKRRFQNGEVGSFTGASVNNDEAAQSFRYKKYGNSSVLIPLSNLESGEYCLSITNSMTNSKSAKVYTFSIK
ncbi:MAG: hypothetical protein J6S05_11170 [Bacteroidaceae bacterium]|nr:hypothetical protein [Bacteroidaceae bacterium]